MDPDVLKWIGDFFEKEIFNDEEGKKLLKGYKQFPDLLEEDIRDRLDKLLIRASLFLDRRIKPDFENDPKEIYEYLKDRFFKAL